MKSILLALIATTLCGLSANSQSLQPLNDVIINDLNTSSSAGTIAKTVTCGPDTVQYPTAKSTGLTALSINNATSAQALCQYYNCPQPITISGAEFYAYKIDATGGVSINVNVKVYIAGADSMPSGAPLVTTIVPVDTAFGGGNLSVLQKVATFSPTSMTVPYVIVVENLSPNGLGLVCNDYNAAPADGLQEWLCGVDLFGTWTRPYGVNVGGVPFDADLVIHPIVSYDLTTDFTISNACMTAGPTVSFTDASSPILMDRMYNIAAYLGTPELSYSWDYGDGSPIDNVVNGLNVYGATGNVEYAVTLTDTLYGWTSTCTEPLTQMIGDSLSVDWSNVPSGTNVAFTDLTYATAGVSSWLWDFGDGNTSTAQNPSHIYAAAGTYTVCLTAVTNCGTADSTCQSVTVSGCPMPTPGFSTSVNLLSATFTNSSTSSSPPVTYLWDFGDGNNSTQMDPSHTYATSGTYTVCLTISDACGTDSVCQIMTVTDCVDPTASFTVVDNEPTYDFTNTSTTTGGASYLWDMGDGVTTYTTLNATHTYTANGTYIVTLTVTDSCETTSTVQTVNVTILDLDEINFGQFSLYPNPSNDLLIVEATKEMSSIALVDITGKVVLEHNVDGFATQLSTAQFASGTYVVRISQSNGYEVQRRLEIAH